MIRVKKSDEIPESLIRTKKYDGEDVKSQLLSDQYNKCYICERELGTDFEIEHFKSQEYNEDLKREWSNLFMACSYCNGRKSSNYDYNINPELSNVEEEINQKMDFKTDKAIFIALVEDDSHRNTVELLMRLYNGKGKFRDIKEGRFWKIIKFKMNDFQDKINEYLRTSTEENEDLVRNELKIDKELLGFKYWVIKDNEQLNRVFGEDIVWNKIK